MSMGFFDMLKLTYKVLQFKYDEKKFTTNINAIVKTAKGSLKGIKRLTVWGDDYFSFEKIPFAKPPVGELRFKAPVPVEAWDTILDCTNVAEVPMQIGVFFSKCRGSEDCLYLNVYTRDITPSTPRPVMVWIYGGGFQMGEATRDMYCPDFLMSKDVVLVTIAYRLGPFGFLSLDDAEVNVPGNAGLKDQILGLRWVKENIANFGGDAANITVFGESAGGASTHICMLSPKTQGLFHKAIVMSGSALCPWASPPRKNWAYRLAKHLGYAGEEKCKEVYKFLMEAKGADMVKAAGKVLNNEEKHNRVLFAFGPVIEPYDSEQCVLYEQPYELMKTAWSNDIPLMIGGTSFEGLLFYGEVTRRPATLREVRNCQNLLPTDLGIANDSSESEKFGLELKKLYFGDQECSPETKYQFLELQSDRDFWHPIYRTVQARLRHSTAPTYIYRFDYDSKEGNAIRNFICGKDVRGVCHGDDMCYLFRSLFAYRAPKDSTEERVTRTFIDIFTAFAANSDPNCQMIENVRIESISKNDAVLKCLNISEKSEFIDLPQLKKLEIWNSFYPSSKL